MTSTLQNTLLWNRALPSVPSVGALQKYFQMYAKGKRLSEQDIQKIGLLMDSTCRRHPGCISYNGNSDPTGKRTILQTSFYYVSPGKRFVGLDEQGIRKLNPHELEMSITGEHCDFSTRKTMTHVRSFPITLDNEKLETAYLKETGELFSYSDPRTQYLTGLTLLMLQAAQTHYDVAVEPDDLRLLIPYGGGMVSGMLETNKRIDTRHKLMAPGAKAVNFVPVEQAETRFSAYLNGYLPRSAFTPQQDALYNNLLALLPPERGGQFAEAMDAYLLGETVPAADKKSDALVRLEAFMETPAWINATQRTAVNRFKGPFPAYAPGNTTI